MTAGQEATAKRRSRETLGTYRSASKVELWEFSVAGGFQKLVEHVLGQVYLHDLQLRILLSILECEVGIGSILEGNAAGGQSRRGHLCGGVCGIVLVEAAAALISHQTDVKGTGDAWRQHRGRVASSGSKQRSGEGCCVSVCV